MQHIVAQYLLLWLWIIDIQNESLANEHNESAKYNSGIPTEEEEVDDSHYKHGCCGTIRKSFLPVKFWESSLVEKQSALWMGKQIQR